MKRTNRILSMLLAVVMVVCMLPTSVSAAEFTQAFYFELADMLQWSDVGAALYYVELYKEGETERLSEWEGTANNVAAASIIPYSGRYYFIVYAYNADGGVMASKTSEVFTYTDKTPPVVSWYPYDGVERSSDAEANVRFDNLDHRSACTYYYAVVESGAAAPTIDTSGAGITANAGSDNYIDLTGLTAGAKDIYLVLKDQDGNAGEPIMTTIPAYVEECTCVDRCMTADLAASNCPVCIAADSPAECMGTPELMENGSPWRLSDTKAEVGFYGSVNPNVVWMYCYLLTDDSSAQPTASEILAGGTSGVYEDPHTLVLTDLTAGEKYIHIVLHQEEQNRTTNVLRLTIPAFVKLTLTPSANGGDYDAETNTLTIAGGGTVNFALNAPGYVHCDSDDTIEATPLGDEPESATEWMVTLPATPNTYTFYYGLGGQEAWCTIVVVEEAHTHSHSTLKYNANKHWYECSCGAKSGETTHTYSTEWSSDGDEHWHECSCGAIDESSRQSHEKYAPGFSEEVHWWRCLECNYYFLDPEPHTMELRHDSLALDMFGIYGHRWACTYCAYNLETEDCTIAWEYDNTYHWWDCTECGYEKSESAHDGEKSCATCGWSFARSTPTGLRWDTSNGAVAVWDAVDGATHYIVELYKKDIISLRLISHVISDTSFDFDSTSLLPGSYYFTVRATCDDIKSKSATSNDIIMTSGGTPILFNGSSKRVDYIDGTAFVVGREDIADGSVSEVDMTPITGTTTLTEEQVMELIKKWRASWDFENNNYEDYMRLQLENFTLSDLEVIQRNLVEGSFPDVYILDVLSEEIKSREATDLVVAPGYIDSTSYFKVTTGQALGVTYSNDALRDLLTSVDTGSNIKVSTKFEKAEITRDEARIIVEEWAEIVNTAEGEEQIKNLLTTYSIYELALLQQYTKILVLDDSTAQKLYALVMVERDKKKEEAATKDNEEPLATFSVNTYAVAADGTQTYIPVQKSMQYAIPVDMSGIPENATLALYRLNEDGTRTKQEILSILDNLVIAQTGGNSDYVLVYELAEEHTHTFEWKIDKEATETEDGIKHEECACGEKRNENTIIPKAGSGEPHGLSIGGIIAIVAVIGGVGLAAAVTLARKKEREYR